MPPASTTPLASFADGTLAESSGSFIDVRRLPDLARAWNSDGEVRLQRHGGGWEGGGIEVGFRQGDVALRASVGVGVTRLQRWRGDLSRVERVPGDHWERSYADLAWRGVEAARVLPW